MTTDRSLQLRPTAPIPGRFLYVAWNVRLRLVGPLVLPSRARRHTLATIQNGLAQLEQLPGMDNVRLFESAFVVPIPGAPRFDVAVLLDGGEEAVESARPLIEQLGAGKPEWELSASNVQRFGDTDDGAGPIMLNHFASSRAAADVARVWSGVSDWYGRVLGVDNSTLLAFDDSSRFVVMNYASIPGPVVRFMANQLLRPSFRRKVLGPLSTVDARALPVFARRVRGPVN